MTLLKITANLLDGRVATTDGYFPIDSIIQYAHVKKYTPNLLSEPLTDFNNIMEFELPITKINKDTDDWYYKSSFAMFNVLGEDRRFFNKRYDTTLAEKYVNFNGKSGKVNIKSDKFKNWRMPLNVILTPKMEWCIEGDEREITSLLSEVTHIGKKASQGLGIVKSWEVESTTEDLTHLRPIPDRNGTDEIAIRPLYFDSRNIRVIKHLIDNRLGGVQLYDRW
jgi:CRISPR type IV-associated protein Csf3